MSTPSCECRYFLTRWLYCVTVWKAHNTVFKPTSQTASRPLVIFGHAHLRPNSIKRYPARELVLELVCDQLVSWIAIELSSLRADGRRPGFCRDSSNMVADRFAVGLLPARELVRELLASWIAPDRPISITLSSSLAGRSWIA